MRAPLLILHSLLCGLLALIPQVTSAALLYFDPSETSLYRGDTVTVALRLDTDEGECINTIDAVVRFDAGIRAVDVSTGSSILNIWVEKPTINEDEKSITLAGGIIGGYCGRAVGDPSLTNIIAEIVFLSPGFSVGGGSATTTPKISLAPESRIMLNDGFGTEAPLQTQGAQIRLESVPGGERIDSWSDRISDDIAEPGDFAITLSRDETAFSGNYFITWNAQDKQSGIDHYEVMEEPLEDLYAFRWGRADAPWIKGESPFVLTDQTLNSTIRVKAIDKAGNETIAVLVPDTALRKLSFDRMITFAFIGGFACISLMLIAFVLIRRKQSIENAL